MAKEKSADKQKTSKAIPAAKRTYIKQSDVPLMSLDEALRIPQAILDHYAGKATAPLYVAKALNVDPKGSQLKFLSGAAIAFGLIEGGAQATSIGVTELARRILRPKTEGGDLIAKREAVLTPRIFKDFLTNYDGNPFPRQDIALNVLEDMGVPRDKASEVFQRIESSAKSVGFLEEIKGKLYVSLQGSTTFISSKQIDEQESPEESQENHEPAIIPQPKATANPQAPFPQSSSLANAIADDERRKKVFITHGKNKELVEPIKKLLEFGELVPVVSVERQSVSKPVPEKIMDDMRACGAAIIHVDAERTIIDKDNQEHVIINPNVLIEIGAAMGFYGRRFILLVKDGVKLPSNLQGLYEVRYTNDILDATATIKLLEAIKDIKNYSLPSDNVNGD